MAIDLVDNLLEQLCHKLLTNLLQTDWKHIVLTSCWIALSQLVNKLATNLL
jgi:hypothetical protein